MSSEVPHFSSTVWELLHKFSLNGNKILATGWATCMKSSISLYHVDSECFQNDQKTNISTALPSFCLVETAWGGEEGRGNGWNQTSLSYSFDMHQYELMYSLDDLLQSASCEDWN